VTRAVDVRIVAIVGLVFDVRCRDGNAALALFGSLVDGAVFEELSIAFLGLTFRYGCCEGGLRSSLESREDIKERQCSTLP
jgi:hypothetical protein